MASSGGEVQVVVQQQFTDYLRQTPKAVAVLVCSFFSGQLWAFLVFAYIKKGAKGNKLLQSLPGKTSLGLCWFTLVLVPIYYLNHGTLIFSYDQILSVIVPTLVAGFFVQVIAFALIVYFGK